MTIKNEELISDVTICIVNEFVEKDIEAIKEIIEDDICREPIYEKAYVADEIHLLVGVDPPAPRFAWDAAASRLKALGIEITWKCGIDSDLSSNEFIAY